MFYPDKLTLKNKFIFNDNKYYQEKIDFQTIYNIAKKHKLVKEEDYINLKPKQRLDKLLYELSDYEIFKDSFLIAKGHINLEYSYVLNVSELLCFDGKIPEARILRMCVYLLLTYGANSIRDSLPLERLEWLTDDAITDIEEADGTMAERYDNNFFFKAYNKAKKDKHYCLPSLVCTIKSVEEYLSLITNPDVIDFVNDVIELVITKTMQSFYVYHDDESIEDTMQFVISANDILYENITDDIEQNANSGSNSVSFFGKLYTESKVIDFTKIDTTIASAVFNTKRFNKICHFIRKQYQN